MKSHILLRAASLLSLVHALLHHFGGMSQPPSHGLGEVAVQAAMKSFHMDLMGSQRSYWDFYYGFGLFITVSLTVLAVVLWQLATLAKASPSQAKPIVASLSICFLAYSMVSCKYIFIAPFITELLIALLIATSFVLMNRESSSSK